jgi:NAD(P)-dependent dehydrogenase (short-subunit alcohol dehydrogenase family)
MTGTVIITGGNGSLGLSFIQAFLTSNPEYTIIATVRNPSSEQDPNTAKLRKLLSAHPESRTQLETLDLGRLADVRAFTTRIADQITVDKLPRIVAIVCNAFTWSLHGQKTTTDNYEATFQVSHLSHMLLVLRLLGSMDPNAGRIVLIGSEAHDPLSRSRATFPEIMEHLVQPPPDGVGEVYDKGFQRYGTAKLANVAFMHDLNTRLLKVSGRLIRAP